MAAQTKFEIEDVHELAQQLKNFVDVLSQEFDKVLNQWQNLECTWRDRQCGEFTNSFFDSFQADFKDAIKSYDDSIYFLDNKIKIAEQVKSLEKLSQDIGYQSLNKEVNQSSNNFSGSNTKPDDASAMDKIAEAFSDNFYKTIGAFRKGTAGAMMFMSIFSGGLMKNYQKYEAIASPLISAYDRQIVNNPSLPKDSVSVLIKDMADEVKKVHRIDPQTGKPITNSEELGVLYGLDPRVEEMNDWLGVLDEKRKKEREILLNLPDHPETTGGK